VDRDDRRAVLVRGRLALLRAVRVIGGLLLYLLWVATVIGGVWVIDGLRTRRILVDVFTGYDLPLVQKARCRIEYTVRSGGRTWAESEDHWRGFALRLPLHRALFVGRRERIS
jgi:hypothetical protein